MKGYKAFKKVLICNPTGNNSFQYVAFLAIKQLMEDSTEKYTVKIPITDIRGE